MGVHTANTTPTWGTTLAARTQELRQLVKTDGDPRVRQRAHALLLVAEGRTMAEVARLLHMAAHRLRVWRGRFLVEGRAGLVDRPRRGRPPALDAAARAFLEEALEQGPQAYGLPTTIWSIRDLQALLLHERGITVSVCTLHRVVQALGFRYRRPRHDLRHRQDREAVAAAEHVLQWLQKKAVLSPSDSIWSMWMNVRSIPTLTWQRSGADAGCP